MPLVEAFARKLCEPLSAKVEVTTPSKSTDFFINVQASAEGTCFIVDIDPSPAQIKQGPSARNETFWAIREMEDFVCQVLAMDLLREAKKTSPKWENGPRHDLRLSTVPAHGKHCLLALKLDRKRLLLTVNTRTNGISQEEQMIWYGDRSRNETRKGFYESLAGLESMA